MVEPVIRIGTAGWTIPAAAADAFPLEGSSLERYSQRLDCAEINSSFHRSHRSDTWRRWASSVPESFLFSAKLSKEITHKRRLVDCEVPLAAAIARSPSTPPAAALRINCRYAAATRQSSGRRRRAGLLRFARNDGARPARSPPE